MRAYVIVTDNTDVQFLWHDDAFLARLRYLSQDTDNPVQLSEKPSENGSCVQMFLSPIVISYFVLRSRFGARCKTITCSRVQCDVVFQEHDNLLYIGFCDKEEFSVYKMEKALSVLHGLTEFFYGPCQSAIKPLNPIDKTRVWDKIWHCLHSYLDLYNREESFLVGCVDRLHVNVDVRSHCCNIAEHSIKVLAETFASEKISVGILFVGSNVLAYETVSKKAFQVQTADLLTILALIHSKYREEELDAVFDASSAADAFDLTWPEEEDSSEEDVATDSTLPPTDGAGFSSNRPIPVPRFKISPAHGGSPSSVSHKERSRSARSLSCDTGSRRNTTSSLSVARSVPRSSSSPATKNWPEGKGNKLSSEGYSMQTSDGSIPSRIKKISSARLHSSEANIDAPFKFDNRIEEIIGNDLSALSKNSEVQTCAIFLHRSGEQHAPFVLRSVDIAEQIKFVVLSEVKGGNIASILSKFLLLLKKVLFTHVTTANEGTTVELKCDQKTFDKLSTCCRRLKAEFRRHGSNQLCQRIFSLWEKNISRQLQYQIKHLKQTNSARLEQCVSDLKRNLQTLFQRLFLRGATKNKSDWHQNLMLMKYNAMEKLSHHLEFLIVKSYRNAAINWNREEFPGMLHFLFVKRTRASREVYGVEENLEGSQDELISSTLCIPPDALKDGTVDEEAVKCIKNQVWKATSMAYAYPRQTEDSVFSAVDGDFRHTSYFWDDSCSDAPAVYPPISPKPASVNPSWYGSPSLPQIERNPLARHFRTLDNLVGGLRYFELHLVHFSTVSNMAVDEQSDRLCSELAASNSFSSLLRTKMEHRSSQIGFLQIA